MHIYHIDKNNPFCTLYHKDCVSNYISRKMSVSHDIIMIEHNSNLPIRVLFCCFLCSLLNRFRLSHACHTRFLFFAQFSQWLSSTFHSFSTQITIGSRLPSYRYRSFTLRTYLLRHTYCQFLKNTNSAPSRRHVCRMTGMRSRTPGVVAFVG